MQEKTEIRQLRTSPSIIYSLIRSQAGTLAKGLLECVMNSIDAGATQVDISLDHKGLTVKDDGKGFDTREEVLECFEVFGFEHIEGERKFGEFGIGRAQLWNFCSTVWLTNEFRFAVDIKRKGLDYELTSGAQRVKGLTIEGELYEEWSTTDILAAERELRSLCEYVAVPVTMNGRKLTREMSEQKWTHETDEAWISLNPSGRSLTVYNLGVKVRDYPAYQFGCGGIVVTKPGVRMKLNMARNDIILSECGVWKKIRPFLKSTSDGLARKSNRLTAAQLAAMASGLLSGEVSPDEISKRQLFKDILGKRYTLEGFTHQVLSTSRHAFAVVPDHEVGPVAEATQRLQQGLLLSSDTLETFGVASVNDLFEQLRDVLEGHWRFREFFARAQPLETWRELGKTISEGYTVIDTSVLTKRERAAFDALTNFNHTLAWSLVAKKVLSSESRGGRKICVGVSEVADAWTDGVGYICVERGMLKCFDQGVGGVITMLHLLVHEYLHDVPSTGTHVHDQEFYQRFHDIVLDTRKHPLADLAVVLISKYIGLLRTRKLALPRALETVLPNVEAFGFLVDDGAPADEQEPPAEGVAQLKAA